MLQILIQFIYNIYYALSNEVMMFDIKLLNYVEKSDTFPWNLKQINVMTMILQYDLAVIK